MPTKNSWLFPPETREVQFDEKWSFVYKKEKNCDPANPDDSHRGDYWDHVAYDPEHKLVLEVIPGARSIENAEAIVEAVKRRLGGEHPDLMTSDEYPAYARAIEGAFGEPVPPPASEPGDRGSCRSGGCPRTWSSRRSISIARTTASYAVEARQIFGTPERLEEVLGESATSSHVNTSFVERQNGTDRGRNAREARKTYRFSKDWEVHEAMTYLTMYSYNFRWCVRTLRIKGEDGCWQQRSPALAAGLTDHVWTWKEWFRRPAVQSA